MKNCLLCNKELKLSYSFYVCPTLQHTLFPALKIELTNHFQYKYDRIVLFLDNKRVRVSKDQVSVGFFSGEYYENDSLFIDVSLDWDSKNFLDKLEKVLVFA